METKTNITNNCEPENGAACFPVNSLVMRCVTCKFWQGDKQKALQMYKENPLSMGLIKGWPDDGACGIDYEWLTTEINGNATVENTVDANFGCVYWEA